MTSVMVDLMNVYTDCDGMNTDIKIQQFGATILMILYDKLI